MQSFTIHHWAWIALTALSSCASIQEFPPGEVSGLSGTTMEAAPFEALPSNADPAEPIAGLHFLTGTWIAVNPNKTVNEEMWSAPRGNVLIGAFRQVHLNGDCTFIEMSQISYENDEIVLRLRHLHGRLEVPEDRKEVSLFRLMSLGANRVEFTGTEEAKEVTSVIYERVSPTELTQAIGFAPESGQEAFVTRYMLASPR